MWSPMAAVAIGLSEIEERELRRRATQYTRPHREVIRAKVVLLAADGHSDCEIARRLTAPIRRPVTGEGASPRRAWRGWMSGPGRGVPGRFPPAEIAEVKALACDVPAQTGRPLSRWSAAELAREAVERGIVCSISGTTVWRWLSEDAIRPWAWRSWLFCARPGVPGQGQPGVGPL